MRSWAVVGSRRGGGGPQPRGPSAGCGCGRSSQRKKLPKVIRLLPPRASDRFPTAVRLRHVGMCITINMTTWHSVMRYPTITCPVGVEAIRHHHPSPPHGQRWHCHIRWRSNLALVCPLLCPFDWLPVPLRHPTNPFQSDAPPITCIASSRPSLALRLPSHPGLPAAVTVSRQPPPPPVAPSPLLSH